MTHQQMRDKIMQHDAEVAKEAQQCTLRQSGTFKREATTVRLGTMPHSAALFYGQWPMRIVPPDDLPLPSAWRLGRSLLRCPLWNFFLYFAWPHSCLALVCQLTLDLGMRVSFVYWAGLLRTFAVVTLDLYRGAPW